MSQTETLPAVVTSPGNLPAVVTPLDGRTLEMVLVEGDLKRLTPSQRASYYQNLCQSLGLNAMTRPFGYLELSGKLTLYAFKGATDQLRMIHGISVEIVDRRVDEDAGVYVVTARATAPSGRTDEDTGAVAFYTKVSDRDSKKMVLKKLTGDDAANAIMRAETKAKRRVTLSICGLSFLDETELDTVRGAKRLTDAEVEGAVQIVEGVTSEVGIALTTYEAMINYAESIGISPRQLAIRVGLADAIALKTLSEGDFHKVMADLQKVASAKNASKTASAV